MGPKVSWWWRVRARTATWSKGRTRSSSTRLASWPTPILLVGNRWVIGIRVYLRQYAILPVRSPGHRIGMRIGRSTCEIAGSSRTDPPGLLDAHDHRVRSQQVRRPCFSKAHVAHPGIALRASVVGAGAGLDE